VREPQRGGGQPTDNNATKLKKPMFGPIFEGKDGACSKPWRIGWRLAHVGGRKRNHVAEQGTSAFRDVDKKEAKKVPKREEVRTTACHQRMKELTPSPRFAQGRESERRGTKWEPDTLGVGCTGNAIEEKMAPRHRAIFSGTKRYAQSAPMRAKREGKNREAYGNYKEVKKKTSKTERQGQSKGGGFGYGGPKDAPVEEKRPSRKDANLRGPAQRKGTIQPQRRSSKKLR